VEPTFRILSKLQHVTATGPDQWSARCPCHDDQKNSLGIIVGADDRAVLKCLAGCSTPDIIRTIGETWSSLFRTSTAKHPSQKSGDAARKIVATYDYHTASGELLFQVVRYAPKDFRQRRPDASKPGQWIWKMDGVQRVLYHLPDIANAPPDATIYVVEGEKDADKLRRGGFIATTIPGGAGKWSQSYAEALRGRHVVLIPDMDRPSQVTGKRPGWEHVVKVGNALLGIAASIRVLELPNTFATPLVPKWDVSDWIAAGGTKAQFLEAVAKATAWQRVAETEEKPNEEGNDPHRLARLFFDRYKHADGSGLRYWSEFFHRWDGLAYRRIPDKSIRPEVASLIKEEFDRINVHQLANFIPKKDDEQPPTAMKVTTGLVANVLQALEGMSLLPHHVSQPAWLDGKSLKDPRDFVAMRNGILDIDAYMQRGESLMIPHTPRFFSPVCLPFPFDPMADCPKWCAFVDRNLEGDSERIDLLQEWFGYCLTPDTSFQKFLLMEGEGSNGKSVICAALTALLGDANVSGVRLEQFGERFQLISTVGKLANIAAEVGDLDKIAEGHLKSFTAGDRMMIEPKFKDAVDVVPTARLVLATNNRPRFGDRSNGIWRRMLLLPFRFECPENEKVHNMDKAFWWEQSGELPGMFMWALVGLQRLRKNHKFTESAICKEALSKYRAEVNPARQFLADHYHADPDDNVVTSDVYSGYRRWCDDHGNKPLASSQFGKEVQRMFPAATPGKVRDFESHKRVNGYYGIGRRFDEDSETLFTEQGNQGNSTAENPGLFPLN